jgi:nitrogen regulatory protein P-II 1
MPVLLIAIIDDTSKIWDVLDEWERLGVCGATILDSGGLRRMRNLRDDLPLFPSVRDLLNKTEAHHRTILSVLEDNVDVEAVVRATERIVGPLNAPHTGILFTLPVLKVWGLRQPGEDQ